MNRGSHALAMAALRVHCTGAARITIAARRALLHYSYSAAGSIAPGEHMAGDRVRELITINKSLSVLGNCIEVLTAGGGAGSGGGAGAVSGRRHRAPYRDSVLTVRRVAPR